MYAIALIRHRVIHETLQINCASDSEHKNEDKKQKTDALCKEVYTSEPQGNNSTSPARIEELKC